MRIKAIEVGHISLPLVHPFKTALRTVEAVEDVVVRVVSDDGTVGYGEAPPTAVITGDTTASILCAIREYIRPALVGMDVMDLEAVMRRLDGCMAHNTTPKAAVDMAVYDLWARAQGKPLYQLLGGARQSFQTDLTISVNPVDQMVSDSLEAVDRGFGILKVKVGKEGLARTSGSGWTPTRAGPRSSRCPSSGPWRTGDWTSNWWSSPSPPTIWPA